MTTDPPALVYGSQALLCALILFPPMADLVRWLWTWTPWGRE